MEKGLVYFLGAGASRDAGLPLSKDLTKIIVKDLNPEQPVRSRKRDLQKILNFVVSAMVGHQGKSGKNPDVMPDIESVVSAVDLLSKRFEIELAPFVQNWDPAVDLLDKKTDSSSSWARDIRDGVTNLRGTGDYTLKEGLVGFMEDHYKMGISGGQYTLLMYELLGQLKTHLTITDSSLTEYLKPLVELGKREKVTIATINYDLTIETAAKLVGIEVCRGIDEWNEKWKLVWSDTGVQLIKLHGSIDWGRGSRKNLNRETDLLMRDSIILEMKEPLPPNTLPFVIYGRREKLRPEGPFSELRTELISQLRAASHLVVIGYSFGDDHINELIKKWLNSDLDRRLIIVDPFFPKGRNMGEDMNAFQDEILYELQRRGNGPEPKLSLIRVLILRKPAKDVLPDLCQGIEKVDQLFEDELKQ